MEHQYEKNYEVQGQTLIYHMPKELDHHVATQLCKELDMLVEAYSIRKLELDFSKTEFMDSSGIGVVIGRSKTMQYRSGTVSAHHLGRRVAMIFQSAGLHKIVEIKGEKESDRI